VATQYSVTSVVTLVASTAKTAMELPTSATAGITIVSFEVMSAATAAGSLTVEWGTYTTTGTGTTYTPGKWGTGQGVAANTGTIKVAHTAEPAGFTVGSNPVWIIPLPGMYSAFYPFGREPFVPASTLRAFRLTGTQAGAHRVTVVFEVG
jgi:hypothetical protein